MTSLRRYLILAALVALAVPAIALAARAKQGIYLQNFKKTQTQFSVSVAKGGRTVTGIGSSCAPKGYAAGGYNISKKLGITRARKFYFHGKVTLPSQFGTPPKALVTVHGRFTSNLKHVKGTITGAEIVGKTKYRCAKVTFNAPYFGNPKGG